MTRAGVARRDRARYLEALRIRAIVRAELEAVGIPVDNSVDNSRRSWGVIEGGQITVESGSTPPSSTSLIRRVRIGPSGQLPEAELLRGYGLELEDLEP